MRTLWNERVREEEMLKCVWVYVREEESQFCTGWTAGMSLSGCVSGCVRGRDGQLALRVHLCVYVWLG